MKEINSVYGSRFITIWHVGDDMSRFTNDQLLDIGLCDIDQATGEKFRRNYLLTTEQ